MQTTHLLGTLVTNAQAPLKTGNGTPDCDFGDDDGDETATVAAACDSIDVAVSMDWLLAVVLLVAPAVPMSAAEATAGTSAAELSSSPAFPLTFGVEVLFNGMLATEGQS